MTAFLRLNGITVPVQDEKASESNEEIGSSGRALDGAFVTSRRAVKRRWEFSTSLITTKEASAFRNLVNGRGYVFSFDSSLYSSKGTAASGGTVSAVQKKFGANSAQVPAAGALVFAGLAFDPTTAPWSVSFWFWNGTVWAHYVETSDGTQYVNGVAVGGNTFTTTAANQLTLTNPSGAAARYFDDVWITQGAWPSTWPAMIYGYGAAVPQAPTLVADGLAIENNLESVLVRGEAGQSTFRQGVNAGAWTANLQALSFTLQEI